MTYSAIGGVLGLSVERTRQLIVIGERRNAGMGPIYDYVMRVRVEDLQIHPRRHKKTMAAIERLALSK